MILSPSFIVGLLKDESDTEFGERLNAIQRRLSRVTSYNVYYVVADQKESAVMIVETSDLAEMFKVEQKLQNMRILKEKIHEAN
jgi:uncharacterized protein with PIN domain